jgi:hypothetical protein
VKGSCRGMLSGSALRRSIVVGERFECGIDHSPNYA